MTEHDPRPKFWSSLFRKQPIERGIPDPVGDDIAFVRAGFQRASQNLTDSVNELLDDLERKQRARAQKVRRLD
jgi:hypothetical protein